MIIPPETPYLTARYYTVRDYIRGAFRSVTIWVNTFFLALYPFAETILYHVESALPQLAQYLPDDTYKAVGLAIVIFNIYQRTRTTASLPEKGAQ